MNVMDKDLSLRIGLSKCAIKKIAEIITGVGHGVTVSYRDYGLGTNFDASVPMTDGHNATVSIYVERFRQDMFDPDDETLCAYYKCHTIPQGYDSSYDFLGTYYQSGQTVWDLKIDPILRFAAEYLQRNKTKTGR